MVSLRNLKEQSLRHTGLRPCPGKYLLRCFLDSGIRRNAGVGIAAQSGVDVDSTLALV